MDEVKWYQDTPLETIKSIIKDNINIASRSFVAIGYYLKSVRDRELYLEDGYQSIWEFAQAEFGISKSSASRFMAINDRFSQDGNSPILLEQYKDFSSSKLSEMLTMSDEQLEQVTITTTRAEIREIKQADKVVAPAQQETEKAKSLTIDDLDLSVSAFNALHKHGIDSIEKLCEHSEQELLDFKIGDYYVKQIMTELEKISRSLKKYDSEQFGGQRIKSSITDIFPEFKEAACDGNCFYCKNEGCNGSQEKRTSCIYDTEKKCNLYNAHEVALNLGVNCISSCCNLCNESCGARCNHSAHGAEKIAVTESVEIVPEYIETVSEAAETVIEESETVSEEVESELPCDTCGHDYFGSCNSDEDDYCVMGDKWISRESDRVETVEADIIQTVKEDDTKEDEETEDIVAETEYIKVPGSYDYNLDLAKEMLKKHVQRLKDALNVFNSESKSEEMMLERFKLNVAAFKSYIDSQLDKPDNNVQLMAKYAMDYFDKLDYENADFYLFQSRKILWDNYKFDREHEVVPDYYNDHRKQPELPILKNNDQRKDFIDNYTSWPVWIDQSLTGEKYYRYDLTDNVAIVVKVSRKHAWERYKETKDFEYAAEQYYLLGIKTTYSTSQKGIFTLDESRTFYECNTNKSTIVEYLKEFQKKE